MSSDKRLQERGHKRVEEFLMASRLLDVLCEDMQFSAGCFHFLPNQYGGVMEYALKAYDITASGQAYMLFAQMVELVDSFRVWQDGEEEGVFTAAITLDAPFITQPSRMSEFHRMLADQYPDQVYKKSPPLDELFLKIAEENGFFD